MLGAPTAGSASDRLGFKRVTPVGKPLFQGAIADVRNCFIVQSLDLFEDKALRTMLRFRDVADYAASPELAPEQPISGAEAYDRYMVHTMPYLAESGGELLFLGEGGPFLIGPEGERWDRAMLVKQSSVQAFMSFASNDAYLAGIGHRTAALEDSRLLPLAPLPTQAGSPESSSASNTIDGP
jgi:uncharacterized protein (DUF1330 family)